ncbi:unnamed protein product [Fraxinus pennsylvanica]|uniref:Uncharacterized protein n=1 Tax=Fraxinus pennsylvanica TaxID=56036 RepID=A0AAD1YST5_9LAMI|nr:unnamed protein product [Fraxinus pennsylvanica]
MRWHESGVPRVKTPQDKKEQKGRINKGWLTNAKELQQRGASSGFSRPNRPTQFGIGGALPPKNALGEEKNNRSQLLQHQVMQRDYKLSSYSLNSVSAHFLNDQQRAYSRRFSILSNISSFNYNARTIQKFSRPNTYKTGKTRANHTIVSPNCNLL